MAGVRLGSDFEHSANAGLAACRIGNSPHGVASGKSLREQMSAAPHPEVDLLPKTPLAARPPRQLTEAISFSRAAVVSGRWSAPIKV